MLCATDHGVRWGTSLRVCHEMYTDDEGPREGQAYGAERCFFFGKVLTLF